MLFLRPPTARSRDRRERDDCPARTTVDDIRWRPPTPFRQDRIRVGRARVRIAGPGGAHGVAPRASPCPPATSRSCAGSPVKIAPRCGASRRRRSRLAGRDARRRAERAAQVVRRDGAERGGEDRFDHSAVVRRPRRGSGPAPGLVRLQRPSACDVARAAVHARTALACRPRRQPLMYDQPSFCRLTISPSPAGT